MSAKPEKPQRRPYHEEFAEQVIKRLEAGTTPWQKPWEPGTQDVRPHNPVSGTVYKGVNRVKLAMSDLDDPRWMTFRQAKELGLKVMAGSQGTSIVHWQFTEERDVLDEEGRPVLGQDGKPLQETLFLERPKARYATVFNGSQIEGLEPYQSKTRQYAWDPQEKAEDILQNSGAAIHHDQRDRAYYSSAKDQIHLPPKSAFAAPDKYYATAVHELAHWTGHESRQNREFGPFGSAPYAKEELRAEIASWMLGEDIGVGHDPEQHAAYVKSWIKVLKEDPHEILRACRDAEKIKDYALKFERERSVEKVRLSPEEIERIWSKDDRKEYEFAAMRHIGPAASEKTFLAVPFAEKDLAKAAGARWDNSARLWYAPAGANLLNLAPWLPDNEIFALQAPPPQVLNPEQEFARALKDFGLDLKGAAPIMDGRIHRVPPLGEKSGAPDGAYSGYLNGHCPAGWMHNHKTGERLNWSLKESSHTLTEEERLRQKLEAAKRREASEAERRRGYEAAAVEAREIWAKGHHVETHPYLQKKDVEPFGVQQNEHGFLHIPARDVDGKIHGIQSIGPDGDKQFQPGMEKKRHFHAIAAPDKDFAKGEIMIAEGYATSASLHQATGQPVAVAFDAGNLIHVARALRDKYPEAKITICADYDRKDKDCNVGVDKAKAAALAVGAKLVIPVFTKEELTRGLTDFNDLHQSRGLDEVKKQINAGLEKSRGKGLGRAA